MHVCVVCVCLPANGICFWLCFYSLSLFAFDFFHFWFRLVSWQCRSIFNKLFAVVTLHTLLEHTLTRTRTHTERLGGRGYTLPMPTLLQRCFFQLIEQPNQRFCSHYAPFLFFFSIFFYFSHSTHSLSHTLRCLPFFFLLRNFMSFFSSSRK